MSSDGQPEVGRGRNLLGVVVDAAQGDPDVVVHEGAVRPGEGGMSVAPKPETLPVHRQPKRLREQFPGRFPRASGSNTLHCWSMGEGAFTASPLAAGLAFRPDPTKPERHGFVEPECEMPLEEYERAVTATRSQWVRWDEEG